MRITYVARSFLDYRVPVLAQLDELTGHSLHFVTSAKWSPPRAMAKARNALGDRFYPLDGEWSVGEDDPKTANRSVCVPYQPNLVRIVAATEPDVILSDGFFQWTVACLWLRAVRGIPHAMCYERTAHTERHAQWYRKAYRRVVFRWIDSVCCSGTLCRDYTVSMGFPLERTTCGHMVADTEGMAAAVRAVSGAEAETLRDSLGCRGTVYLYVGQMIPRKGLPELLTAWHSFSRSRLDDAVLLLVGDGTQREELEAQCRSQSLTDVRFIGAVDYDELAPYYAAADAFVIPTLEDNWSLVVPEAMACGLPILCSKYNGCWPELVHEGRNGWVFDPLAPEDTTRVLLECHQQRDRLAAMGSESLRMIEGHTPLRAAESILAACRLATRAPSGRIS